MMVCAAGLGLPGVNGTTWAFPPFLPLELGSLCSRAIPGKGILPVTGSLQPALSPTVCASSFPVSVNQSPPVTQLRLL